MNAIALREREPSAPAVPVEAIALEDSSRKTLLTEVEAVRGQAVLLPKSIYHAARPEYGHRQPSDKGHLLVGGHKLKIERVAWRDGDLLHHVAGPPPRKGEKVLAHLDWPRRHLLMRAHVAAHVLASVAVASRATVVSSFEVLNGGGVKATLRFPGPASGAPAALAALLKRANGALAEKLPVAAKWMPADEAARRGVEIAPSLADESVVRVVTIGEIARHACDAPMPADTREAGRVVAADVLARNDGTRVVFKLAEAA